MPKYPNMPMTFRPFTILLTYNESSGGTRHGPSTRLLVSSVEKLPDFGNDSTGTKNCMVLVAKSKVTDQT